MQRFFPGRGRHYFSKPLHVAYFGFEGPFLKELRMQLHAVGHPYRLETYLGGPKFRSQHKGSFPFGRLPCINDGPLKVAQSRACARYLAQKLGLDGGLTVRMHADQLTEMLNETRGDFDWAKLKEATPPSEPVHPFHQVRPPVPGLSRHPPWPLPCTALRGAALVQLSSVTFAESLGCASPALLPTALPKGAERDAKGSDRQNVRPSQHVGGPTFRGE